MLFPDQGINTLVWSSPALRPPLPVFYNIMPHPGKFAAAVELLLLGIQLDE